MVGNNTIEMNQATMVKAMQCYLETIFQKDRVPVVTKVTHVNANAVGGEKFMVAVQDQEDADAGSV